MSKAPTPKADQLRAMREAKYGGQRRKPVETKTTPKPQNKKS